MFIRKISLICAAGFVIILISCSLLKILSANTDSSSITEIIITPSPVLPIYHNFPCIPSPENPEVGYVVKVIDGDSIKALIDGKEFELRYIGINSPEYYSDDKAAAERATRENKVLVEGKKIYLFKDVSNTDYFGRLLRYVFTDNFFVNFEMVERGMADSKPYYPDVSCQKLFNQASQ